MAGHCQSISSASKTVSARHKRCSGSLLSGSTARVLVGKSESSCLCQWIRSNLLLKVKWQGREEGVAKGQGRAKQSSNKGKRWVYGSSGCRNLAPFPDPIPWHGSMWTCANYLLHVQVNTLVQAPWRPTPVKEPIVPLPRDLHNCPLSSQTAAVVTLVLLQQIGGKNRIWLKVTQGTRTLANPGHRIQR